MKYVSKEFRVFADIDNERPFDEDIVGLTQTDNVTDFFGRTFSIKEGEYLYLYMDYSDGDHVFFEGIVIRNPYPKIPYRWCCKLAGKLECTSEYENRFSDLEKSTIERIK
jgi:hypothetical protein